MSSHPAIQASHVLKLSPHFALRQLEVRDAEDALVISGTVSSYYLKQLAQEAIKPIRGPFRVDNRVHVSS